MAIEDWIFNDNLKPFTHILGSLVGYEFDEPDWAAIRFGCEGTDVERGKWFDYELSGQKRIRLALAQDIGTAVVFIRCQADGDVEAKIEAVIMMAQDFRLQDR